MNIAWFTEIQNVFKVHICQDAIPPIHSTILQICVIKIGLGSNLKYLSKINEGTEWSKISIRAVFWQSERKKRILFARFKSCIF